MTKKKKITIFITAGLFIIIIGLWHSIHSYNLMVDSVQPTCLQYKGVTYYRSLNSTYAAYLDVPTRTLYFGKFPKTENKIIITIPAKVTITVYPNDNKSVLINFDRHNGICSKYKLSGYGDFNSHLRALYDLTGDEVFNEMIDLPEAK